MTPEDARSTKDIIRDLLDFAQGQEWVEVYVRCARGCCGEWETRCPSCGADREPEAKHEPGCRLATSIQEAEAFLAVEDDIELEDHGEALPCHPA